MTRNSNDRKNHSTIFLNLFRPRYLICKNRSSTLLKFNASNRPFIQNEE